VIGREAGEWLRSRHEALGIGFRCETTVESVSTPDDGSALLHLADGSEIGAAAVLVSVGVVRDCGWLAEAGLEVDGGLVCDAYGRSSLPDVFGAGDIVRVRGRDAIGHWTRAGDSARRAAHALMGLDKPSVADDGYFWSDQFEMRIQFAGRITERSRLEIVAGSLESGSFLAQVKSDDQLTGLFAVNKPRDFMVSQHKFTDQLTAALAVGASR
jgi:3-phenylpropionate/trans-cinnamate dioxygenase ferredoxin reductase subunit